MTLLSVILFVSPTKAQVTSGKFHVYAWVDKLQYAPGDSGTLYVTIRNDNPSEVYIYNITVEYPWHAYVVDHWEGNDTVEIKAAIERDGGVLNKEFTFEVPKDGKAIILTPTIDVDIWTDELDKEDPDNSVLIDVANPPDHIALKDMDMWMTSLTVAIVVCTIILAIVVLLATRRARAPRPVIPRAPAPPPPPKAKAT